MSKLPQQRDGGPAWPCEYNMSTESGRAQPVNGALGLTWLDYAAIKIAAILPLSDWYTNKSVVARCAYDISEALLAEKRRRELEDE